jgi:hypothetical protein
MTRRRAESLEGPAEMFPNPFATTFKRGEIDVQDAEHFVGELGPTFPVVRSTSESTPQTERQCAEKLTF